MDGIFIAHFLGKRRLYGAQNQILSRPQIGREFRLSVACMARRIKSFLDLRLDANSASSANQMLRADSSSRTRERVAQQLS